MRPNRGILAACCAFLVLIGCEKAPPNGRIRVKNDTRDSTYNVVEVSGGGAMYSLDPGESALMPPYTSRLSFSRRYKDFTRRYSVECPLLRPKDAGIQLKLIDVHTNRMRGGCKTTYASKD